MSVLKPVWDMLSLLLGCVLCELIVGGVMLLVFVVLFEVFMLWL